MRALLAVAVCTLAALPPFHATAADGPATAAFTVTTNVVRPAEKVPPLGANDWGRCGAVEWAANNFVRNAGNEPVYWRNLHRVMACGDNWFEIDGAGTSWYALWNSGFLSGARLRFYRIVDKNGEPLPPNARGSYVELANADHVVHLGDGRVIPEGTKDFPDGGWLASRYAQVYALDSLPAATRSCTDSLGPENGRTYWYVVVAMGPDGRTESEPSNEANATPKAGLQKPAAEKPERVAPPQGTPAAEKPAAPTGLNAVAGDGCVMLSWQPSASSNVTAYRVKRSTLPAAKQVNRVHVEAGAPAFRTFDYVVVEKKFEPFLMKYANPRVRGIGNPQDKPNWYWRGDLSKLSFSLVPHPQPAPDAMVDPGETCMRVDASAGRHSMEQIVFMGTAHGKESAWYGQLEPGRHYRLEAWLRQEGLGDNGRVTFSYGSGYPEINSSFNVTSAWQCYTFAFDGPARPVAPMHFGHTFTFTGPGTLWLDNCRIYRVDKPEDADKLYVPNATVFDELMASQPAAGSKGAHRTWYLDHNATLSSIMSWHANSAVNVDWSTSVGGTMDMTLPMGLMFDLRTGDTPATRMRPWLVLQHILHTEQDWRNLIEYLAAPYDPKKDTPETKPWAHRRFQQRGVATPWVDEFPEIVIEFGNETWHNGVFADWIGFSLHSMVHQGGVEYGLFTRYLIEEMKKSPYWTSCDLDRKIRFDLGGNYDCRIGRDGSVHGYGEDAIQANPHAGLLGHANYVGPKWETGDYTERRFDDNGVQACLLSFLTGVERSEENMGRARELLITRRPQYDIAAYEGGPGGYALPGHAVGNRGATEEQTEINEQYGKSLAQAVGALDCWLGSYAFGWTYQCYLGYGQGTHWKSHTIFADGFRPHVAWQALALRNREARGDLMRVDAGAGPAMVKGTNSYPLIGVYALRDGTRWSVFVLSRALDGEHDGRDFGTGIIPVTLHLPFKRAGTIALHTLAGNPRVSNREAMNVKPGSSAVPAEAVHDGVLEINQASGGVQGGMPPGSIYLYVFNDTSTTGSLR